MYITIEITSQFCHLCSFTVDTIFLTVIKGKVIFFKHFQCILLFLTDQKMGVKTESICQDK